MGSIKDIVFLQPADTSVTIILIGILRN